MNKEWQIADLPGLNNIPNEDYQFAIHFSTISFAIGHLCDLLNDNSIRNPLFRECKTRNRSAVIQKFIHKYISTSMSEKDFNFIESIIELKMNGDIRKPPTKEQKDKLLKSAKNRCACCNCEISSDNCHIDHIIPFSWVGDQLHSNYQPMCSTCNKMKSDDPLFIIKYFAINGKMVAYLKALKSLYNELSEKNKPYPNN